MPLLYTSTPLLPVTPLSGQAGRQNYRIVTPLWKCDLSFFSGGKKKNKVTMNCTTRTAAGNLFLFMEKEEEGERLVLNFL